MIKSQYIFENNDDEKNVSEDREFQVKKYFYFQQLILDHFLNKNSSSMDDLEFLENSAYFQSLNSEVYVCF